MGFVGVLTSEEREATAAYCSQATSSQYLDHQPWGNTVLRYDAYKVVKFGRMVSEDEARNQASVSQMVNQQIVCVPRVYDWFQDKQGLGYIVMEYIEGEKAERTKRASTWRSTSRSP